MTATNLPFPGCWLGGLCLIPGPDEAFVVVSGTYRAFHVVSFGQSDDDAGMAGVGPLFRR